MSAGPQGPGGAARTDAPSASWASGLARILRLIARALLIAFAIGFTLGTLIRCAAESRLPPRLQYLGERAAETGSARAA